jgi:hypothetical protein
MVWNADRDAAGQTGTQEGNARGWKQPIKAQSEDAQHISGKAKWDQGRWTVVMKRPLITDDKKDVQFKKGVFIPMSVNAWDGSNGEHGLIMSVSSWHFVVLEAPTPISVYIYAIMSFLIAGFVGIRLKRKVENENEDEPAETVA